KRLIMHDLFDGMAINHHERQNVVARAQQVTEGVNDLENDMLYLAEDIDYLTSLVKEVVIVKSNHDEFLDRYLQSGYYVKDPQNHRYALDLAREAIDGNDPLQYAVTKIGLKS